MDMESSMMFFFFSKEELKDTDPVLVLTTVFWYILLALHIISSYLPLCARLILFHEVILSSWVIGDPNFMIDFC